MQLAPSATLAHAMFTRLPFAVAVDFQPRTIDHDVKRAVARLQVERNLHLRSSFWRLVKLGTAPGHPSFSLASDPKPSVWR